MQVCKRNILLDIDFLVKKLYLRKVFKRTKQNSKSIIEAKQQSVASTAL
jgi:hypothetical protein